MVDYTIYRKIRATKDTYVDFNYPTMNFGNYINLDIDYRNPSPSRWKRPHLYFPLDNILPIVPPELEIYGALLGIYQYYQTGYANRYNKIYAAAGEWDEIGLNWNNKPDFEALSSGIVHTSDMLGWRYCDVKDLVIAWLGGAYPNYGLIIEPEDSIWSGVAKFYSRSMLNYEPYLNISWRLKPSIIGDSYIID